MITLNRVSVALTTIGLGFVIGCASPVDETEPVEPDFEQATPEESQPTEARAAPGEESVDSKSDAVIIGPGFGFGMAAPVGLGLGYGYGVAAPAFGWGAGLGWGGAGLGWGGLGWGGLGWGGAGLGWGGLGFGGGVVASEAAFVNTGIGFGGVGLGFGCALGCL